jgi:proteasome lid subunit RPN8/RPN11
MISLVSRAIRLHAKEAFPDECCGIITHQGEAVRSNNLSRSPTDSFLVDFCSLNFWDIKYVYHSHPKTSSTPSRTDIEYCNESCVPFIIYSLRDDDFYLLEPG